MKYLGLPLKIEAVNYFSEFVDYCDKEFDQLSCGKNEKKGCDCYPCIKFIHDFNNRTEHYSCPKMMMYYVPKHLYRYSMEIMQLCERIQSISNKDEISFASIGCGPCSELFGTLCDWKQRGKDISKYHFKGFDTEQMWTPVMAGINNIFANVIDAVALNSDFFSYYQENPMDSVDVLLLNYMLSDSIKFDECKYLNFVDDIYSFFVDKKPEFLLVNDVYCRYTIRAYNILERRLTDCAPVRILKLHYPQEKSSIGVFGRKVEPKIFNNSLPQKYVDKYDPFWYTNSIQSIIKFDWSVTN